MRRLLFCLFVSAVSCSQPAAREMSEGALDAPAVGDSILISATEALQNGQPWRAAQILEPVLRDSTQRTPERVLLAARAAAEWGGWSQVDRLLTREPWLDSRFDGLGRVVAAGQVDCDLVAFAEPFHQDREVQPGGASAHAHDSHAPKVPLRFSVEPSADPLGLHPLPELLVLLRRDRDHRL